MEPSAPAFTQELIDTLPRLLAGREASLVLSPLPADERGGGGTADQGMSLLVQGRRPSNPCSPAQAEVRRRPGQHPVRHWQLLRGLDLPGHYLTNLVITKLPFAVPNSPVEGDRRVDKQRGGNPFLQLTVPEASLQAYPGL